MGRPNYLEMSEIVDTKKSKGFLVSLKNSNNFKEISEHAKNSKGIF